MSERAVPFHCPYCGDEDLRPHEGEAGDSPHGEWDCRSCLRAFSLRMLGLVRPSTPDPQPRHGATR
ncbi:MAG TPA: hypothetical protein VH085_13695 [Nocardioides sp.]|nr:hypothetical protein [Nocardioides sp.]